jgi:hypothetical protein
LQRAIGYAMASGDVEQASKVFSLDSLAEAVLTIEIRNLKVVDALVIVQNSEEIPPTLKEQYHANQAKLQPQIDKANAEFKAKGGKTKIKSVEEKFEGFDDPTIEPEDANVLGV